LSPRLEEKKCKVWYRTLIRKAGSCTVTVPQEILQHLELKEGDQLIFLLNPERKYVMIASDKIFNLKGKVKINGEDVAVEFLRAPLTVEDLERLTKQLQRKSLDA